MKKIRERNPCTADFVVGFTLLVSKSIRSVVFKQPLGIL